MLLPFVGAGGVGPVPGLTDWPRQASPGIDRLSVQRRLPVKWRRVIRPLALAAGLFVTLCGQEAGVVGEIGRHRLTVVWYYGPDVVVTRVSGASVVYER